MTQANDAVVPAASNGDQRQHPGPGHWLKQARERRSWSQREAADMLNLSPRFIVAMEDETFDKLPAAAFARGYLRAYAKLLGLVGDEIIRRYEAVVGDDSDPYFRQLVATRRQPLADFVRAHPGLVVGTIALLLATVLIGGGWLLWRSGGIERAAGELRLPEVIHAAPGAGDVHAPAMPRENSPAARAPAAPAESAGETLVTLPPPAAADIVPVGDDESADAAHGAASGVGSTNPARAAANGAAAPRQGSAPVAGAVAAFNPAGVAGGIRGAPATDTSVAAGAGSDQLRVTLAEDCWVEVRDARGTRLYSGMARRGANLAIAGNAPMTVVLGNAPAAQLLFNGRPVEVASHTKERIATLVVARQ